jgi:hypothetical protein
MIIPWLTGKLRVLSSYVPRYLLKRLRKYPDVLTDVAEDRFNAVIAVVDISGFTQLR